MVNRVVSFCFFNIRQVFYYTVTSLRAEVSLKEDLWINVKLNWKLMYNVQ